jgi:hypothetical protein
LFMLLIGARSDMDGALGNANFLRRALTNIKESYIIIICHFNSLEEGRNLHDL